MEFLRTYAKELVALFIPILTAIINHLSRSKVRLTFSSPHGFTFLVQQPLYDAQGQLLKSTQTVQTRSFWFSNDGRAIAHRIEVVFNWKPLCLNVWPSRRFEGRTEPDNRYILTFESLAPKEHFGCELLSVNAELPALITLRCDEAVGSSVTMYPQRTV